MANKFSKLCLLLMAVGGLCSLQAKNHSSSSSSSCGLEPCGPLEKTHCKVVEGCVRIPARTQQFFVGEGETPEACSFQQELVPQAKLFYRAQGKFDCEKPTIVFIHGFAEAGDVWLCSQRELCDKYYTIAMDLRGNGRSSKTPAFPEPNGIHYTQALNTEDVFVLLDKLGIRKNIVLVGHSVGGTYAMNFAAQHPDRVIKLIVTGAFPVFQVPNCAVEPGCEIDCYNPFTCEEGFCAPFGTTTDTVAVVTEPLVTCLTNGGTGPECLDVWARFIAPLWYSEPCQDQLQPAQNNLIKAIKSMTVPIVSSIFANAASENLTPMLSSITVPTLITYGAGDIVVNPGSSQVLNENIPNSVLVEFVGKGHQMHVTSYKAFDKLIEEFITGIEFPAFSKVLDQGCCICPLVKPMNYAKHSCD